MYRRLGPQLVVQSQRSNWILRALTSSVDEHPRGFMLWLSCWKEVASRGRSLVGVGLSLGVGPEKKYLLLCPFSSVLSASRTPEMISSPCPCFCNHDGHLASSLKQWVMGQNNSFFPYVVFLLCHSNKTKQNKTKSR